MKSWISAFAVAISLGPLALFAAEPAFHVIFKPVRTVRISELVQIELDVAVTNVGPAPAIAELTFIGSRFLEARYARPFGRVEIARDQSARLRQLITVPEVEVTRWERQQALPRFRIEFVGAGGHGVADVEAVPQGPPEGIPAGARR